MRFRRIVSTLCLREIETLSAYEHLWTALRPFHMLFTCVLMHSWTKKCLPRAPLHSYISHSGSWTCNKRYFLKAVYSTVLLVTICNRLNLGRACISWTDKAQQTNWVFMFMFTLGKTPYQLTPKHPKCITRQICSWTLSLPPSLSKAPWALCWHRHRYYNTSRDENHKDSFGLFPQITKESFSFSKRKIHTRQITSPYFIRTSFILPGMLPLSHIICTPNNS